MEPSWAPTSGKHLGQLEELRPKPKLNKTVLFASPQNISQNHQQFFELLIKMGKI